MPSKTFDAQWAHYILGVPVGATADEIRAAAIKGQHDAGCRCEWERRLIIARDLLLGPPEQTSLL